MSDDQRIYEVNANLLQNPRLQRRPLKGKGITQSPALESEAAETLDHSPLPVTPDLILRLIKVLKES
jgi:hypothetical protein